MFGDQGREEVIELLGVGHRLFEDVGAEAVFEAVKDDGGLTLWRARPGRRLGVASIGVDLRLRSNKSVPLLSM
jgi:hypothetical protein